MYDNESNEYKPNEDATWTREELALDAHLERQEATARRDQAEGLLELREFTGRVRPCDACYEDDTRTVACSHIAAPVAMALNGWLAAVTRKPAQSAILNESEAA